MNPRVLPTHPNLEQIKNEARVVLHDCLRGDAEVLDRHALSRVVAWANRLSLADVQLLLARGYGYVSWPKRKGQVDAQARACYPLEELVGL